jgi:hypothetical protein
VATRLVERTIRVPPGAERHELVVTLPEGAEVLAIIQEGNQGVAVLRGDPQAPDEDRYFIAILGVEGQAGVLLTAREAAGTYVGSFRAYARERGQRTDLYNVFEVAPPALR